MHIVSRAIQKDWIELEDIKKLLLELTSLLCLSRSIKELDEVFRNIVRLLLCKKKKSADENFISLGNKISRSSIDEKEINQILENEDEDDSDVYLLNESFDTSIYRNSPFFQRYDMIKNEIQNDLIQNEEEGTEDDDNEVEDDDENEDEERKDSERKKGESKNNNQCKSQTKRKIAKGANKYNAPGFLDHLLLHWMPYVILWSALDLDLVDPSVSRVTNA